MDVSRLAEAAQLLEATEHNCRRGFSTRERYADNSHGNHFHISQKRRDPSATLRSRVGGNRADYRKLRLR